MRLCALPNYVSECKRAILVSLCTLNTLLSGGPIVFAVAWQKKERKITVDAFYGSRAEQQNAFHSGAVCKITFVQLIVIAVTQPQSVILLRWSFILTAQNVPIM